MAKKKILSIAVLGDGGWGTTLSILLYNKGYNVVLWGAFPDYVSSLKRKRINSRFLPGIKIPKGIKITDDLASSVIKRDLIILTIPSQHLRGILRKMKKYPYSRKAIFLSAIKGIEVGSLSRISQVIHDELGAVKVASLSGPTIAHEVALNVPTTAVIASHSKKINRYLQSIFMNERFRIYTNSDLVGVELGGSLKNIIAIACGISDGLGFGTNTKAALLSRGLVEISRLGQAMGAKKETFSGISGLGDLVTTCISPFSRNRNVGEQIGKGKTLKQVVSHMRMIAEGIPTTKSAYLLSKKYRIEMPITKEVYQVLYKNKPASKAVKDLMTRAKRDE